MEPVDRSMKRWQIRGIDVDSLVSPEDFNFQVIQPPLKISPDSMIQIDPHDTLRVQRIDRRHVLLTITKAGSGILEATGTLELEGWFRHAWAEGEARDKHGKPVGKFYLFMLTDRAKCCHTSADPRDQPCRSVHLEYFEEDYDFPDHIPEWKRNVLPAEDPRCINLHILQTDEGDADEGRTR